MPPVPQTSGPTRTVDFSAVQAQWRNPTDILSILMIIGGDIVRCALAQSTGGHGLFPSAPVAFSFGWVAYSFSTILSAVGDRRLFPSPDYSAVLVNAKSGQRRENRSWLLGRIIRDFEREIQDDDGLAISFQCTSPDKMTGIRAMDWVHIMSVITIALQVIISTIPIVLHQNYMILILTIGGTALAYLGSILPQWREEKWAARPLRGREVVVITPGNGARTAVVIVSDGEGMKLEDLAAGRVKPSRLTMVASFLLAILWLVHLVTVESLSSDAWYSLAVGALGMTQNVISAGAKRKPGALGLHLEEYRRIRSGSVFDTLRQADDIECGVGVALLPIFLPGRLRPEEEKWREEREAGFIPHKSSRATKKNDSAVVVVRNPSLAGPDIETMSEA